VREVEKTANGADKYWELGRCLRDDKCPLEKGVKHNLEFLISLRHEIEHRCTNRIDEAVSAKLQACCINFNDSTKQLFGPQFGLERRLPIALQFVAFGADQRALLKRSGALPPHIETMMTAFHDGLSPEDRASLQFAHRVAYVEKIVNRPGSADVAVEFVKADSDEVRTATRIELPSARRCAR
jgi:uncharacterized protein DUF3644